MQFSTFIGINFDSIAVIHIFYINVDILNLRTGFKRKIRFQKRVLKYYAGNRFEFNLGLLDTF